MTSYWTADFLSKAFRGVNFSFLNWDLTKCWGHDASTIKIKVMQELSTVCGATVLGENHTEVVNNLVFMMNECDIFKECSLTSPSHTQSVDHYNDDFQFFDFNKMKLFTIHKQHIPAKFASFDQGKKYSMSPLIFLIKSDNGMDFIENNKADCFPRYVYKGDTALTIACRLGRNEIAFKLIDTFGIDCLMVDDIGQLSGIELKQAIQYKNELVALKIIETFEHHYPIKIIDLDWTLLMYAIDFKLPNVCNKLLDIYKYTCQPEHKDLSGTTALILACKNGWEHLAVKMIELFGLQSCMIYHVNNRGEFAIDFAKKKGFHIFLHKVENIENIKKLEEPIVINTNTECNSVNDVETANKLSKIGHCFVEKINNLTEILSKNESMTSIYYKGVTITTLDEAVKHYQKMVLANDKDCGDFKRVITFFV